MNTPQSDLDAQVMLQAVLERMYNQVESEFNLTPDLGSVPMSFTSTATMNEVFNHMTQEKVDWMTVLSDLMHMRHLMMSHEGQLYRHMWNQAAIEEREIQSRIDEMEDSDPVTDATKANEILDNLDDEIEFINKNIQKGGLY